MATQVTAESLAIKVECTEQEDQHIKDYNTIKKTDAASSDKKQQKKKCYSYYQKGTLLEHIGFFCGLASASYAGVLSRIYLSKLANWNGVQLSPSLYPQIVGTVIMGFVISHNKVLENTHPIIYQALATGLCGSITTFSSWNSEAVSTLLQTGQEPPNNLVRIFGWVTTLLLGLGMSAGALAVGKHLAMLSPRSNSESSVLELSNMSTSANTTKAKKKCHLGLECGVIFSWVLLTAMVVALLYEFDRLDLLFPCIFAPIGTYTRWHLAPLNSMIIKFKLGTFLVNVLGSWLLGGVVAVQDHVQINGTASDVLRGVETGFCGSLTTVSTFAMELAVLPIGASYLYAFLSILLAQVGMIIIRGTVLWTTE